MYQPDYNKAFQEDVLLTVDRGTVAKYSTPHRHTLGELVVTSGRVVVCDPLVMPGTLPLANPVPPGRYP